MIFNRIYLAARYSRYPEMQGYARQLEDVGFKVTSRWIYGGHDTVDANSEADKTRFAQEDLDDLLDAHTVVSFTEDPDAPVQGRGRGGRHTEFGVALGSHVIDQGLHPVRQRLVVIGYRENVFHWLPQVQWFKTWDEFFQTLRHANQPMERAS